MIENIKKTSAYTSLMLEKDLKHAYFLYSIDKELNNNIALNFARSIVCQNKNSCGECNSCKQFNSLSHPDVMIIDQASIKVEDANKIINRINTKAVAGDKNVFVILNCENMNETAQNKLLKSFEEPNPSDIFILTCSKTDKILPTVLSRMKKVFVPRLSFEDKLLVSQDLEKNGIDISKYLNSDFTLTEMINLASNDEYNQCLTTFENIFKNLNSSGDIPSVVSQIGNVNKEMLFSIFENVFLASLKNTQAKFPASVMALIKVNFSEMAIRHIIPLIEDAYRKFMSNVNFIYIMDNLLFNILKEKYLCK